MERRSFGATDLRVSAIGLGTWPVGGARYGPSDDGDARRAIRTALDLGVTCFDTAPSYGNGHAEALLGEALGANRSGVALATKGGLVWNERSEVVGRDSSRPTLQGQIEASLRRLRTDYVDVYLIHWPDPNTPIDEVAGTLESLVRTGKARYAGVSNFHASQLRGVAAALRRVPLTASQVGFNLFDRRWAQDTFEACRSLGVGVMAYGALAHGLLAGGITRATVFEPTDWRAAGVVFGQPILTPEHRDRNLAVVERLTALATGLRLTLPQLAIAWVLAHPQVTVALVGARAPQEIEEAAGGAGVSLGEEAMEEIGAIMQDAAGLSTELPN